MNRFWLLRRRDQALIVLVGPVILGGFVLAALQVLSLVVASLQLWPLITTLFEFAFLGWLIIGISFGIAVIVWMFKDIMDMEEKLNKPPVYPDED